MSDPLPLTSADGPSALPRWQDFMKPLLEVMSDGVVWDKKPLEEAAMTQANLTEAMREEVLPSGQYRGSNRIGWALSFLARAQCITKPTRAKFQLTDSGRALLVENPEGISERALKQLAAYQDYVPVTGRGGNASMTTSADERGDADPIEQIELGIAKFEADVSAELIRRLRDQHPDFFEQAVVDLLIAMGYGGAEWRVTRLGRTGDGGVDGVINQDALGLSRVYIQAKRYGVGNAVHRPELQGFVGALADKGATQGVFVTTSTFSSGAIEYVDRIPSRVVLIDGARLAKLMIQYRVAVQVKQTYDVVEVDEDYFE